MTEVVEVLTLMKPCFPDADNEPLIFPQGESLQFKRTAKSRFNILTFDGATNHASKRLDVLLFFAFRMEGQGVLHFSIFFFWGHFTFLGF